MYSSVLAIVVHASLVEMDLPLRCITSWTSRPEWLHKHSCYAGELSIACVRVCDKAQASVNVRSLQKALRPCSESLLEQHVTTAISKDSNMQGVDVVHVRDVGASKPILAALATMDTA